MIDKNIKHNYSISYFKVLITTCILVTLLMEVFSNSGYCYPDESIFERSEGYFNVIDENDETILKTARMLTPGNKFLNHKNELYQITEVTEDTAKVEFLEQVELTTPTEDQNTEVSGRKNGKVATIVQEADDQGPVGIYHSHGAESYVPSDGEESIDEGGGILQVAETMAESVENHNMSVVYSDETHVPHDAGAYDRSRRTVEEILKQNPVALVDVHRDAAPQEEYGAEVNGEEGVQILLVIGQQQQNIAETENYAEKLKAVADNMYPNLIKGILYAQGNYNQDMHPRNILVEVGGHENTREKAEKSASLFGEVLVTKLNGDKGELADEQTKDEENGGLIGGFTNGGTGGEPGMMGRISTSIAWIVGVAVFGGLLFLGLNAGSWKDFKQSLRKVITVEFANYLGPIKLIKSKIKSNSNDKDSDQDDNSSD